MADSNPFSHQMKGDLFCESKLFDKAIDEYSLAIEILLNKKQDGAQNYTFIFERLGV